MGHTERRPSTPPPTCGLMTPPPTGGFGERVSFVRPQETLNTHRSQSKVKEGESISEFFDDYSESSDAKVIHDGDVSPLPLDSSSVSSKGHLFAATTATSLTPSNVENTVLDKSESPTPLITAVNTAINTATDNKPFPFLNLPASCRKTIYKHLLVIPSLVCVRQNHTAFHHEPKAFLYAEPRDLLPGISYALTQLTVDGPKSRFSKSHTTNLNILLTSKEIFTEARAVMYSMNAFEIVKPTNELSPQPDFSIRLFPPGYQRLVTSLNIKIRSFYDLDWILSGGYNVIRNYYRGLGTLTLLLELDSATKGFGRAWARKSSEKWTAYIKRLQEEMGRDLFGDKKAVSVPVWVDLRVLFSGEAYCLPVNDTEIAVTGGVRDEQAKREELRRGLVESWELFKKGGKEIGGSSKPPLC
ncbi:hypothetical protein N0V94_004320 [Neodidymelliopsis sp. IMI 364377]|nr:hypothetical protein N0V94_004320 [Neodidymelliopsis sp. IMI 364377]